MKIHVNGEAREVPDSYTAAQLVEAMNLTGKRIAMEVNLEIVPRSRYATHRFQPGDKVEVVQAIGGG
ncbi:sulfur carrier protein ThiS [Sulfurivermis fontis]|uniref:sulfur carrier protein ThiS n=1 Tax=Sulfurivermis fontis TaxID=1972068 RepID=UPI000FDB83B1|nr:sulfur carrier protein ThiS [Sulfurivermis fontis]